MLKDTINADIKTAMKAAERSTVDVLRLILSALKDKEIAKGAREGGLSDAESFGVLESMVKQREQSIDMYIKGGRQELADKEKAEIAVISRYLPTRLSADETLQAVEDAIQSTGAKTIQDMGRVIAYLKEKFAGQMDFASASEAVKKKLSA